MMSSLFGGSTPQTTYQPSGFQNPYGFNISGGGKVSQSPYLAGAIGNLSQTFGNQAQATAALGSTVAPGFSQFRQAGLADITSTFQQAQSNLTNNLSQRRVLGSSFANSSFSQLAADQAQTKADFEAQSYLQELQAFDTLMQQQYQASTQQYSTLIQQSNIESSAALQLTQSNNQIAAQIAQANTQLQAQSQAGVGKFIGTIAGAGLGFALGGPAGAFLGAGIGGAAFGGGGGGGYGGYQAGLNSQPFGGYSPFNAVSNPLAGYGTPTPTPFLGGPFQAG